MIFARRGCCEEAHHTSHMFYIPCNKPARFVVIQRDGNHVAMCEMCADHNIRNRGAKASYDYVDATYRSPWRDNVEFKAAETLREAHQNLSGECYPTDEEIRETLKKKQEILDKLLDGLSEW